MNENGEKFCKDIIWPLKPLKSKERQKMSNLNSPLKPTKVKVMKISVRKMNVNG